MKQSSHFALVPKEGVVTLEKEQLPPLASGELLLKTHYSSVSLGTESTLMAGRIVPLPQRIGYSLSGEVVEIGPDVEGFAVGDRVVATASHADYQVVHYRAAIKIPRSIDMQQAAFFNLSSTAMYALRRSQLHLGESCLVMGQGLVGSICARLAKLSGASPLVVTDLDPTRLQFATDAGIGHAFRGIEQDEQLFELAKSLRSGGFQVVIEATGMLQPLKRAFDLVGERARVVMVSQTSGENLPNFSRELFQSGASLIGGYINSKPNTLYRSDFAFSDSWPPQVSGKLSAYSGSDCWSSGSDIAVLMELISNGMLDLQPLITHRYNWKEIPEIYEKVWQKDPSMLGVLIDWHV